MPLVEAPVAGSGTGTVTLNGTLAQINNLLAGAGGGTLSYTAVGDDPDYAEGASSGIDNLVYRVPTEELTAVPASVREQLYYQATPPFYLQERFCTAPRDDRDRSAPRSAPTVSDTSFAQHDRSRLGETQGEFDREVAIRQAPDTVRAEKARHCGRPLFPRD